MYFIGQYNLLIYIYIDIIINMFFSINKLINLYMDISSHKKHETTCSL